MKINGQPGPLERAIDQQSADWLEATCPIVYDALVSEIEGGHTLNDVRRILRRIFGNDLRDAFVLRVLQAAEFIYGERKAVR